jgi:hypothetical protein
VGNSAYPTFGGGTDANRRASHTDKDAQDAQLKKPQYSLPTEQDFSRIKGDENKATNPSKTLSSVPNPSLLTAGLQGLTLRGKPENPSGEQSKDK